LQSPPVGQPRRPNGGCKSPAQGTALLEVILALALFVVAAAIVTSGMSASTDNLDRQRLNTHAANLAATVLAEIQLGIRPTSEAGEQPFTAPFDQWTSELLVTPTETETGAASGLLRVEVIIRHKESALVRRLAQVIRAPGNAARAAAF
jgi:type II secretory pathway pseudopilin PulG